MAIDKKNVVNNISSGLVQFVISAFLTSWGVSKFINTIGLEKYGVFSLIGIIGSLNSFSNLGLSTTLIKFLAEQGKCKESFFDLITSIILISFTTLPISLGLFLFKFEILDLIGVPNNYQNQSSNLYNSIVLCNVLLMYSQLFSAVLESQMKLYIVNIIQTIYSIIYWGGILLLIHFGFIDFNHLYIPIFVSTLILVILMCVFALKELSFYSYLRYFGEYVNEFLVYKRKQLSYSLKVFLSGMISFFYEPVTKAIVSHYFGLSEIAHFDIALRVKSYIMLLFSKFVSPLTGIIANSKKNETVAIVKRYTFLIIFSLIPFIIVFYLTVPFIIEHWIGKDVEEISLYVRIICISHLIVFVATPSYSFFMLKGYPLMMSLAHIINVLINVLIILVFHQKLAQFSIIIASSVSIILSNLLLIFFSIMFLKKSNEMKCMMILRRKAMRRNFGKCV